jgi:hypothetical protein
MHYIHSFSCGDMMLGIKPSRGNFYANSYAKLAGLGRLNSTYSTDVCSLSDCRNTLDALTARCTSTTATTATCTPFGLLVNFAAAFWQSETNVHGPLKAYSVYPSRKTSMCVSCICIFQLLYYVDS